MRAALRDTRRAAAASRPSAYPLVTPAEQLDLRTRAWTFMRRQPGMSRRVRQSEAERLATAAIAELQTKRELAARKVQPVQGGLIVPRQSLLITPDEARKLATRR